MQGRSREQEISLYLDNIFSGVILSHFCSKIDILLHLLPKRKKITFECCNIFISNIPVSNSVLVLYSVYHHLDFARLKNLYTGTIVILLSLSLAMTPVLRVIEYNQNKVISYYRFWNETTSSVCLKNKVLGEAPASGRVDRLLWVEVCYRQQDSCSSATNRPRWSHSL